MRLARPLPRRPLAVRAPPRALPPTAPPATFADAVSGEWDGMLVAFSADGTPLELPPAYVPEAYREWGVAVCDWQTQASCTTTEDGALRYRLRRLLPSVGCEADATAFVDDAVVALAGPGTPPTTDDGAYCIAPSAVAPGAAVEVCLPVCGGAPRRRLRARVVLGGGDGTILRTAELVSETYDSPYVRDGATLSGCGGSVPQFAGKPRTDGTALDGHAWAPVAGAAFAAAGPGGALQAAGGPSTDAGRGGPGGRLLLPLGAWVAVRPDGDASLTVEAGVLLDGGARRRVGTATYGADRRLRRVELVTEERV